MIDFEEHLRPDKHRLHISFGADSQLRYQWGKTFDRLGLSYVLFKDSTQRAYAYGIQGLGDHKGVAAYIQRFRNRGHSIMLCGVSRGAYGALLYGQLSGADDVVAISPITGQDLNDFPSEYHHHLVPPNPDMIDLKPYFITGAIPRVRCFVSDKLPSCALDHIMATRLGLRNITLVPGYEHHTLARGMRDTGMLDKVLLET